MGDAIIAPSETRQDFHCKAMEEELFRALLRPGWDDSASSGMENAFDVNSFFRCGFRFLKNFKTSMHCILDTSNGLLVLGHWGSQAPMLLLKSTMVKRVSYVLNSHVLILQGGTIIVFIYLFFRIARHIWHFGYVQNRKWSFVWSSYQVQSWNPGPSYSEVDPNANDGHIGHCLIGEISASIKCS